MIKGPSPTQRKRYDGPEISHHLLPKWFPTHLDGCRNKPTKILLNRLQAETLVKLSSTHKWVKWSKYALAFPIRRYQWRRRDPERWAFTFAVYGWDRVRKKKVLFLRYENRTSMAGQTLLYIEGPRKVMYRYRFYWSQRFIPQIVEHLWTGKIPDPMKDPYMLDYALQTKLKPNPDWPNPDWVKKRGGYRTR